MEVLKDFPDNECRIILIGKGGTGKSRSADTILATDLCHDTSVHNSIPRLKCARTSSFTYGKSLLVVDTPGFAGLQDGRDALVPLIKDAIVATCPGPHAILLVVRCDVRITRAEVDVLAQLRSLFGDAVRRQVAVLFTHGDLQSRDMREVIAASPGHVKDLMKDVNDRCVVFNNEASPAQKDRQVQQLLSLVHQMALGSQRHTFISPLLRDFEKDVMHMKEKLRILELRIAMSREDVQRLTQEVAVAPERLIRILTLTAQSIEDLRELQAVDEKLQARIRRESLSSCAVS